MQSKHPNELEQQNNMSTSEKWIKKFRFWERFWESKYDYPLPPYSPHQNQRGTLQKCISLLSSKLHYFFFWLILQYDDLNPTKTKGRTKVVYELNKRRKSPMYCYYCTVAHYRNSTCTELLQISLLKIYPTVSSSFFPCFLLMESCKLSESFKS